jgi:hypothetical protein
MIPEWARELYRAARIRAARRDVPFTLTLADLEALVSHANGRCSISGIPFEFDKQGHRVKRPFAPSLDRIDHKGGYVPGNVRFVCVAANVAMNVWGEPSLRRLAEAICGHTDIPGVWSPPNGRKGVAAKKLKGGRYSYQARLYLNGKHHYFECFKTRAEAAARAAEMREKLTGIAQALSTKAVSN